MTALQRSMNNEVGLKLTAHRKEKPFSELFLKEPEPTREDLNTPAYSSIEEYNNTPIEELMRNKREKEAESSLKRIIQLLHEAEKKQGTMNKPEMQPLRFLKEEIKPMKDMYNTKDIYNTNVELVHRDLPSLPIAEPEDMVNHPSHYNPEGGRETLDYMEFLGGTRGLMIYCTLNAVKYRERAYKKNTPKENFEKAEFYMKKADELRAKLDAGAEVGGAMDYLN